MEGQDSHIYVGQSTIVHLSSVMCKCNDIDRHALYRKCYLSINGACATSVHVSFDMGADPISFINSEHDDDDSKTMGIVELAETTMISSTYGL